MIGGSPCQDLSIMGKKQGLSGVRSGLFFDYVKLIKILKPTYIVLENVASMKKEHANQMSQEFFGIQPTLINSALLTAQNRKRLYWVGKYNTTANNYDTIPITLPKDTGVYIKDIVEHKDFHTLSKENIDRHLNSKRYGNRHYTLDQKHGTLNTFKSDVGLLPEIGRFLSLTECELLQGYPKDYTNIDGLSMSARYESIGNSFTVPVISHILSNLLNLCVE
jgi:DNA (cytosine-5)-methyltransferase 3A